MMAELELCQAPFQCAHGRPSIAPIINLDKLATWLVASKTKNKSDSDLKEVRVLAAYFAFIKSRC